MILSIGYAIIGFLTIIMITFSKYVPDSLAQYIDEIMALSMGIIGALAWSILYWGGWLLLKVYHLL